ncbi:leucine-rich repeat and immunoglobulin-like domain-containing nogo receptor-interacting protein 4 [Microcaecilia unicolor]|uniref:leucine-rich repeat and immunoglobulin-like domain-containing nogo receptor-interacting protein 4 n=1 Tax=Microcaecilia unicolor TaxID=1415580 RepID=UPI00118702A8|nr:leucine-rich repeat and immunoglobulin-like domain-containing nogo receptor-interacting protein 4 [Microcaecilia unicolor]
MSVETLRPQPLLLTLTVALAGLGSSCPIGCECSSLDYSVLCSHQHLSTVPAGLPPDCQLLDLSQNQLRSLSRAMFMQPRALQQLDLSQNLIARIEPGTFSLLTELRTLHLGKNQLKMVAPGTFAGLPSLVELDISHNGIALLLEHSLQDLTELRSLDASHNQLLFVAPGALRSLQKLHWLSLEHSNLASVPSAALAQLPQLYELRLGGLSTRNLRPGSFPALPELRLLQLDWWPALGWLDPTSLEKLNLSSLSLTRCNLNRLPWAALEPLQHLLYLDLSYNPLAELPILPSLLPLRFTLQHLHMSSCRLRNLPASALQGLVRLQLLNVSNNQLQTLEDVALPPALHMLVLAGNPLSCDCRLLWLFSRQHQLHLGPRQPFCASPATLQGIPFLDIAEMEQLTCENEITNCSSSCTPAAPGHSPLPWRLDSRALAMVLAMGFLPFLTSVSICFIFIFLWSRSQGSIKISAQIPYVAPQQRRGSPVEEDENKFTMKLM